MAKLTEETKREIVQLAMTGTMTHKAIAEKFGIGKSTVWYLVDQFKKSGETALSGETEVETEKEPETAATVTGSEQENCDDIPATIVTPSEENVKPLHSYSPLAADAVWKKIENLREEVDELMNKESSWEETIKAIEETIRSIDEQLMFVEAQIDSLLADYEAMVGGAAV
ncbi:MAG: transposase [Oscillospiraceae bacterium]